jgi:iron complex outermembrane receptor protein
MRLAEIIFLFLTLCSMLSAQMATVKGRIYDQTEGVTMAGVEVILSGTKKGTVTNNDGEFFLDNLQPGKYTLNISHLGYQDVNSNIELAENQILKLTIYMKEIILRSVEEIIIEAERPASNIGFNVDAKTVAMAMPDDIGKYFRQLPNTSAIKRGAFCYDPVIRGATGEQLNLQVDNGIKVVGGCPNRMDPVTAHMQSEDLHKIEVITGPYTVRFGPNMSGLVNMVMHKPNNYKMFEVHSSLEGGYETISRGKKARLSIKGGTEKINFYLNGGLKNFQDYQDAEDNKVPAHYDAQDYSLKLGYNFNWTHRLQLSMRESRHKNVSYPALPMDAEKTNTHIYAIDYLMQHVSGLIASIQSKFYIANVEHSMTNLTRSDRQMDSNADSETRNFGARLEIELTALSIDKLYIGSEFHQLNMKGIRTREGRTGTMMEGQIFEEMIWPSVENTHFGVFAEIKKSYNSQILFSSGLRYDSDYYKGMVFDESFLSFYQDADSKVDFGNMSFHIGADYLISDKNTISLRLGQGVRSPAAKELYINRFNIGRDGYEYLGNPLLNPEQNRQIELTYVSSGEKYHLRGSAFYSAMRNYISAEYDSTLPKVMRTVPGVKRFINVKNAYRTGGELQFDYYLTPDLNISNIIAYTYGQNTTMNEPLMEIPPLEYQFRAHYNFGVGKKYVCLDSRLAARQSRISESFNERETPGFNIWNLSAGYEITSNLDITVGIENFFNQWYYEHLNRALKYTGMKGQNFYEPGRNFYLYIIYNF